MLGTRRAGLCFSFSTLFGNSLPAQLFFKLWRYKGLFWAVFALVPVLHCFLHSFITTSTSYTPRYWFRDLLKSSSCYSSAPQYMRVTQQFVSFLLHSDLCSLSNTSITLRGQKVAIMLYDIHSYQQPGSRRRLCPRWTSRLFAFNPATRTSTTVSNSVHAFSSLCGDNIGFHNASHVRCSIIYTVHLSFVSYANPTAQT